MEAKEVLEIVPKWMITKILYQHTVRYSLSSLETGAGTSSQPARQTDRHRRAGSKGDRWSALAGTSTNFFLIDVQSSRLPMRHIPLATGARSAHPSARRVDLRRTVAAPAVHRADRPRHEQTPPSFPSAYGRPAAGSSAVAGWTDSFVQLVGTHPQSPVSLPPRPRQLPESRRARHP